MQDSEQKDAIILSAMRLIRMAFLFLYGYYHVTNKYILLVKQKLPKPLRLQEFIGDLSQIRTADTLLKRQFLMVQLVIATYNTVVIAAFFIFVC